ncbi:T9SS type A sorting domain-containing protein [Labilibacter sediminis]|nr:T9SS type A sorting domain-containing protein [Labilibacter sediminis]
MKKNSTSRFPILKKPVQKTIIIIINLLLISQLNHSQTPDPTITKLFEDAYHTFELMRNDKGMYRDSKLLNGNSDYHPASIANVGTGLITLCIADAMGWESNASQLVITTLNSVNGNTPGFTPDRNTNGYFRHFINMDTGVNEWSSEYSTIDTDLLVMGALFCKNYFSSNTTIADLVDELWNSIDYTAAIADATNGKIYLVMNADGTGATAPLTAAYNEYMIVAYLAANDPNNNTTDAELLWNTYFANPTINLPEVSYGGYTTISDHPSHYLPNFTHQFNYYLCPYFKESTAYMAYLEEAMNMDKVWFQDNGGSAYEWGCGAGIAPAGYEANGVTHNNSKVVSPHIIAGFLPINPSSKNDLLDLYNNNKGVFGLPDDASKEILWRYSLTDPAWVAPSIQGIDFSTFLYGLASLPEYLGPDFFSNYNQLPAIAKTDVNIALGKPVTSVNPYNNNTSLNANVNDGEINTRWSSEWANNQYLYIDLQEEYDVDSVVINWEDAYASEYKIQISNDATNWTDVFYTNTGDGGIDIISFPTNRARYVKMLGISAASSYGFSIWEMKIFGLEHINQIPMANADDDKTITLPANNVVLIGSGSDSDGSITSYLWSQISGPASAVLNNDNTNSLTASNLIEGTYVFELVVTDNDGSTGSDQVNVFVEPEPATPLDQYFFSDGTDNTFYDQGICTISGSSILEMTSPPCCPQYNDKVPCSTVAYAGQSSMKIHYKSASNGNWSVKIHAADWSEKDITASSTLSMFVNPSVKLRSSQLPDISFLCYKFDGSQVETKNYDISSYNTTINAGQWAELQFPLETLFNDPDNTQFDFSRVKAVILSQGETNNKDRTLYVDEIKTTNTLKSLNLGKISETYNHVFSCYPNPFSDKLTISLNNEANHTAIMLYDITGTLVWNTKRQSFLSETINLSSLSNGVYLLIIKTESATEKRKIFKN